MKDNACATVFNLFMNTSPLYMNDILQPHVNTSINSYKKLAQPFRKTLQRQRSLSYIGPTVWNKVPQNLKVTENLNTFKHNVKEYYLYRVKEKRNSEFLILDIL